MKNSKRSFKGWGIKEVLYNQLESTALAALELAVRYRRKKLRKQRNLWKITNDRRNNFTWAQKGEEIMPEQEKQRKKRAIEKIVLNMVGSIALTAIGFVVIPPLLQKYSNKIAKATMAKEEMDFDNLEFEIVRKENPEEDEQC